MNYIHQLNAFEDWLERNYLTVTEQLLWFKLMALNNKFGWSEWFFVTNITLQAKLGNVDEKTLIKYKNKLKQVGLIDFITGKKGSPTKYKIIQLYTGESTGNIPVKEENTGNIPPHSPVQSPVNSPVNPPDNNKPKQKPKQKLEKNIYGDAGNVSLTPEEYERLIKDYGIDLTNNAIEFLDSYIIEKDYKTKDHNRTIRRWVISAVKEKAGKNKTQTKQDNNMNNILKGLELVKGGAL